MKIVLRRVSGASVTVGGQVVGGIDRGYAILLGIGKSDIRAKVDRMVEKIRKPLIFPDESGKTNLSIRNVGLVGRFALKLPALRGRGFAAPVSSGHSCSPMRPGSMNDAIRHAWRMMRTTWMSPAKGSSAHWPTVSFPS